MNKVAAIILILIILAIALYYGSVTWRSAKGKEENLATWKEFTPQSGLFKVLLPNSPQYGKDYMAIPQSDQKRRYDMYASEKLDGTVFLVSVITYPSDIDPSSLNDILHENIDELAHKKVDNRVTKMDQDPFQGHKAYDFGIDNTEFHVEGKAIQADHIVYMLTYITRKGDFDPEEYQHFIDSFQILSHSKEAKQ